MNEQIEYELVALESIYEKDVEHHEEDGKYLGKVSISIELPEKFQVTAYQEKVELKHLPPLELRFELDPLSYPHLGPPGFVLACEWLTRQQLALLCQMMDELWADNQNNVIIFEWIQGLQDHTLSRLGINNELDLEQLLTLRQSLQDSDLSTTPTHAAVGTTQAVDERGKTEMDLQVKDFVLHLMNFSMQKENEIFNNQTFTCYVCYQEKKGFNCIQFKSCDHLFCKSCCKEYFEIQIKEGNVKLLNCPADKCSSQASPGQVLELVGPDLFARYDELLLTSALGTMNDLTYCPQRHCQSAVVMDGDGTATCPNCRHSFCTYCKRPTHGIEPCFVEKNLLRTQYLSASEEEKREMEAKYGRRVLERLCEDHLSEDWVSSNSQPCPKCKTAIEKNDGCHMMTCKKCNSFFCWLCLMTLNRSSPYDHYNERNSDCFERLFEGVENF